MAPKTANTHTKINAESGTEDSSLKAPKYERGIGLPSKQVISYVRALRDGSNFKLLEKLLAEPQGIQAEVTKWLAVAIMLKEIEGRDIRDSHPASNDKPEKLSAKVKQFIYGRLKELRDKNVEGVERSKIVSQAVKNQFGIQPTRAQIAACEAWITMRQRTTAE